MRITNHVILFLMCLVGSISTDAKKLPILSDNISGDIITHIDMHKTSDDSSLNHKSPERNPLELSCYLMEGINTILLSSNKAVSAEIEVKNLTTGDYDSYYDQISTATLSLPLSGTGYYCISITLSNGVNYFGEFTL